ncbi:MAG: glycogen synthase GlgA [Pseudomonadota bacterium]
MPRVLFVASECVPLIKTGGLADVVGALPLALAEQGCDTRVLIPAYRGLAATLTAPKKVWSAKDLFGGPAAILSGKVGALQVMLLDAPHLYDRAGGPYSDAKGDFTDNAERFAALSWAAAEVAAKGLSDGWRPAILHCHDWQAGFAPAYLSAAKVTDVRSVMTIHNIAFQGHAPKAKLSALRLPAADFHPDRLEFYGGLSSLKAGLVYADAITTVSPTYAEELMRPEFGMGLEGVIAARASDLHGILNGIDTDVWSPETDPEIVPYSARSLSEKRRNRRALIEAFGLGSVPGPLVIIVSRMTSQKGLDLVPDMLDEFVWRGGGLAVLGSGDPALEAAFQAAAARNPRRIGVRIGYDEALSHRLFAGGDAVLIPSRFEPCGLTQLYGLRYGTLPVVAATGGLNDTVINASPLAIDGRAANGVTFFPTDGLALAQAMRRLVALYATKPLWRQMQRNAMKAALDWRPSSQAYHALYQSLLT